MKITLLLSCVTNKLKQLGTTNIGHQYHHYNNPDYSSHHSLNKQVTTLRVNNSTSVVAPAQAEAVLSVMTLSSTVLTKSKLFELRT